MKTKDNDLDGLCKFAATPNHLLQLTLVGCVLEELALCEPWFQGQGLSLILCRIIGLGQMLDLNSQEK